MSLFHAVSSFNNAGFDLMGNYSSLMNYHDDVWMNLVTAAMIIIGGLGFVTMLDIGQKRSWKKFSLQTKVVLTVTAALLISGTVLLKLTDGYTWLEAFFQSVTARTAGFNTVALDRMSPAGRFVMVLLMLCGASPGSTGGGIKTTTVFTLALLLKAAVSNGRPEAFRRRLPPGAVYKAVTVAMTSILLMCVSTMLVTIFDPSHSFMSVLFEVTSAVNTVGVTTGITPHLSNASRVVLIVTMYFGRLGPISVAMLWGGDRKRDFTYTEEDIMIG